MKRLICKVFGHRWQSVWNPGPRDRGAPAQVCLRCRENGWVVR